MIDREHDLSITQQAEALLNISRGSVYYLPRPVSATDLEADATSGPVALHLQFPLPARACCAACWPPRGCRIGRRHVKTLMKRIGIEALFRRPRTTKPEPGHKIYPYLLRDLEITRPNQVWAMDITYIPMSRGFIYLAVVLELVQPPDSGMAAVDHDGSELRRRGARKTPWLITVSPRSSIPIRLAVHRLGLHRRPH